MAKVCCADQEVIGESDVKSGLQPVKRSTHAVNNKTEYA